MNQNAGSLTALVSAFSRAYHSQYDSPIIFDDFIAKDLISEKEFQEIRENMIQAIHVFNKEIAQKFSHHPEEILKWVTQVQLSPTPLARAAFCERILMNELRLGLSQYVILGAGLDTFCFRYPQLAKKLEIFEIDHPSMQTFKRERLTDAQLEIPINLHFIPMDFTQHFSDKELVKEGFQYQKTFFSLLGISYYLTKEEIKHFMQHLFKNLPSGSSIVFDYADETLFHEKGLSNRVENMLQMVAVSGEPMKSCFSYTEMERFLADIGLLIYEHLSPAQINEQFFSHRTDYLTSFETIHYIHAVKK
ncbi:SAM-dependent methyltransferase [Bacillus sp. FJAT-27231]|uniref:class I SAM-dependent methyltransferase n=1 Tax=Bacillus sp. FJAT-27231 TaxID=1679168 RepID=UPI000670F5DA|nr:class I SAM-dependent methyltransferase [Bacillus sp. FJAT-27231]KMY54390.1 SAM-dependent methyltransferase [Bacillus sp. FJAT-27231]